MSSRKMRFLILTLLSVSTCLLTKPVLASEPNCQNEISDLLGVDLTNFKEKFTGPKVDLRYVQNRYGSIDFQDRLALTLMSGLDLKNLQLPAGVKGFRDLKILSQNSKGKVVQLFADGKEEIKEYRAYFSKAKKLVSLQKFNLPIQKPTMGVSLDLNQGGCKVHGVRIFDDIPTGMFPRGWHDYVSPEYCQETTERLQKITEYRKILTDRYVATLTKATTQALRKAVSRRDLKLTKENTLTSMIPEDTKRALSLRNAIFAYDFPDFEALLEKGQLSFREKLYTEVKAILDSSNSTNSEILVELSRKQRLDLVVGNLLKYTVSNEISIEEFAVIFSQKLLRFLTNEAVYHSLRTMRSEKIGDKSFNVYLNQLGTVLSNRSSGRYRDRKSDDFNNFYVNGILETKLIHLGVTADLHLQDPEKLLNICNGLGLDFKKQ
jgi:hypothetical protein